MTQEMYVRAAGMMCPVGFSWPSACAAMRAGINRRRDSPYCDNDGREIVASFVEDLIAAREAVEERWLALLTRALRDLARGIDARLWVQARWVFALPAMANGQAYAPSFVAEEVSRRLGRKIGAENVQVVTEGACGGYVALREAREAVLNGQPCIVAAADSLLSARRLLFLSEKRRLLVEGNSDGFTPGEAACAVLLSRDRTQALGCVRGLGFGHEPSSLDNDVPLRAEGLVEAARAALLEAGCAMHELDFRVSDASGESFYFKEQALALARLLEQPKREFRLWLPAETLGDTGAAAGLCGMLWALAGWARGYAPGPRAIAFAGNETGGRAALLLQRADQE